MSTRNIVIGLLAVIAIAALGMYFVFNRSSMDTNQQPADATSESQVQGQEVTAGTGAEAKPGSLVSILYVGKLENGTVFDSSEAHNNEPLKFTLGAQGIIPGFQIGVNGMKVGGERIVVIPPSLGYGAQDVKDASGKVIIPANSKLVFQIKLVNVETPPAATSTAQ